MINQKNSAAKSDTTRKVKMRKRRSGFTLGGKVARYIGARLLGGVEEWISDTWEKLMPFSWIVMRYRSTRGCTPNMTLVITETVTPPTLEVFLKGVDHG